MVSMGYKRPAGSVTTEATWAVCDECRNKERTATLIRLTKHSSGLLLCYDCYLKETGGQWRPYDQYWDGMAWIPLSRGL